MGKINLIVEMNNSQPVNLDASVEKVKSTKSEMDSKYFKMDTDFGTVPILQVVQTNMGMDTGRFDVENQFDLASKSDTVIVRGEINENDLEKFESEMAKNSNVVGVYADVAIEPQLVCPGSGPVGTHVDVENLLCVSKMKARGMTGEGVYVAIVDTGVNMAHLASKGKTPGFNAAWSWKPATSTITVGNAPVGHGTMCAFDVCIAAPKCTLLDIALLTTRATGPTVMAGFLSDAILAYNHLIKFICRQRRPGENASLVVNNSWGMFHPSWDYPQGHPGNYSHNPNHPFNKIVQKLALLGADIIFAAGNCGPECPDGRCQGVTNAGIYGANSSPYVTSVAGIATNMDRVGYSNKGPGNLTPKKPDITGFTHFAGSGVYSADGGTSAACPVVAGVYAAIRTVRPLIPGSPTRTSTAIRNIVTSTAKDVGSIGYDYFYGFGVIDGCKIINKVAPIISICDRYPRICDILRRDKLKFIDLCKKHPEICRGIEIDRFRIPREFEQGIDEDVQLTSDDQILDAIEFILSENEDDGNPGQHVSTKTDCNCHSK